MILALTASQTADLWTLAIAVLTGIACAIPGVFLLLRRMSMMGDAISHAILLGLAGGFIAVLLLQGATWLHGYLPQSLAQTIATLDPLNPAIMLTGAAIVGALTAAFTQWIHQFGRVEQSAAMGVVFTLLFAVGLVMIKYAGVFAGHGHGTMRVDLDPGCVLYGMMDLAAIDTMSFLGLLVPRAVVTLSIAVLINSVLALLFFKELRISAFDPGLAETSGISAKAMHYGLMIVTAMTTVAAFEAVGSILVIAMLVVPAATARLLSHRLAMVLVLAIGIAILTGLLGFAAAQPVELGPVSLPSVPQLIFADWLGFEEIRTTETPGMMAVVAGVIFTLALVFSPSQGVLMQVWRRWSQRSESSRYNTRLESQEPNLVQH